MGWRGMRQSRNVEDRRGRGGIATGGMGVFGVLAVLAVGYFFGIDISPLVSVWDGGGSQQQTEPGELTAEQRQMGDFVASVLGGTEEVWGRVLPEQAGIRYTEPHLVLFSGAVQSACGGASAAAGPFYCPGDRKVYLDTDFFKVMARQMGAGGEFAAAYVIAHEIGHHVQNLTGTLGQVNQFRQQVSPAQSNQLSVLIELQADCYAGIWARQAANQFGTITEADIREAQNAAAAVGDDRLMRQAGRVPMPDAFTHGSSAQRQEWLLRGFRTGMMTDCDTFQAPQR